MAQADTPSVVNVPNTWPGLVMWAVGRFGAGALMAAACAYALVRVYEDQSKMTEKVLSAFEAQATTQAKMQSSLDAITRALEANTREIQEAHRRTPRP